MKATKIIQLACANILLFNVVGIAQQKKSEISVSNNQPKDKVIMAAGPQFKASGSKEFWWGAHWRKEWITPVSFSVFNMDTTAGGLTPIKKGGGHETKTLRMKGANGKEYVLRTIDKSLDVLVPDEFKGSFINDVVNDQISTAHPYGPLVAAQLAEKAGILHTNPVIIFVRDNDRLGEFKNEFGNRLCLFEERASGNGWENTALTGYANQVVNSEELFEKLKEDNDRKVDQKEYLKARFLDMLINDWDRHEDQWVWAGTKKDGKIIYKPFPRDHDQSFSKTDGVNLYFISRPWALRSIQDMKPEIKDVIGTNLSATKLDRRFTNELTEADWLNTIESVQNALTDARIQEALKIMPPEIYSMSVDFLYQRLRARRDNMKDFGMRYYKILNKNVVITGTDDEEIFSINRAGDGTTEITVQALSKKGNAKDTIYDRIFNHDVTKSVNLYSMGNDDKFIYTGAQNNPIRLRAFGGDGHDVYIDSSDHRHISKVSIYDAFEDAPSSAKALNYHATTDTTITAYNPKSFKYDWYKPTFFPGYNPDDGVLIRAGITYRKQQWHKFPFGWEQSVGGTYAFETGAYSFFYKGLFKQAFGQWDFNVAANYAAPTYVVNFYGFGNNTKISNKEKDFYRVRATSFLLNPGVARTWKNNSFTAGLIFNTVRVKKENNKFIGQSIPGIDSSVYQNKYFGGANISLTLNTADNLKNPSKGINFHAGSAYMINLQDGDRNFVNLESSFAFYFTPIKRITIAHRTGAATNIGDFEFYQANTLGGHENLRGYWRTRFTGKSSFYQNTDVRWKLAELKGYFLRGGLGIYGFFDDGRVWIKDDDSDDFHTGCGGGIYFLPFNTIALNLSYAVSKEVNVFTIRAGFLF